jgi:outer membrane protein assembly factor BamB
MRAVRLTAAAAVVLLAACSGGGSVRSTAASTAPTTGRAPVPPATTTTTTPSAAAPQGWPTYFHDNGRSGLAADGPASAAAVKQQWTSAALDGDVYAQPLIVGGRVITATENDTVYALDAATGAVVWKTHLADPVAASSLPCGNVDPVGITGTPVVDVAGGRIYAAGMVQPGQHKLFSLDLASGAVVGSVAVDAPGADPKTHNQRAALTLSNGRVLVPFGGRFGDCGTYHGQLVAVPVTASGLGPPSSYTLPTTNEGGWWAPPGATVDGSGNIFLTSGNSESRSTFDYGNSVIRLGTDLKLADSFAPANWAALNGSDTDLGSTGPVLLPNNRLFQVGKGGIGYLLDSGHLGGIGGQLFTATVCNGRAFGAAAVAGNKTFVPCTNGVAAIVATDTQFSPIWSVTLSSPGPTIVTPDAVWTVVTGSGQLMALALSDGHTLFSRAIGSTPSRFTSPAASGGRVVVGADRKIMSFG